MADLVDRPAIDSVAHRWLMYWTAKVVCRKLGMEAGSCDEVEPFDVGPVVQLATEPAGKIVPRIESVPGQVEWD